MSSYGFEYSFQPSGGSFGGFDPMGSGGYGGDYGGGFMGSTGEATGGKSGGSDKKMSRDRQTLIPVTVKAFNEARFENDSFFVDGNEVHNVKVLGWVESASSRSTFNLFSVNDGTGVVDCKQYSKEPAAGGAGEIREGAFVRIIASPRTFEGQRSLLVYNIEPVTDMNEITHHMLECIYTHLYNTKGPIPTANSAAGQGSASGVKLPMTPSWTAPNNGGMFQQQASIGGGGNSKDAFSKQVYACFKRGGDIDAGHSVDEVFRMLQSGGVACTRAQLDSAVMQLTNEALLYSTTDELHFKPTDDSF